MREIWLAHLDKVRPCLVLTREEVRPYRALVTVAGITRKSRDFDSEVAVGAEHGLNEASVVNLDDLQTIPRDNLIRVVGYFPTDREHELTRAFVFACDLPD